MILENLGKKDYEQKKHLCREKRSFSQEDWCRQLTEEGR